MQKAWQLVAPITSHHFFSYLPIFFMDHTTPTCSHFQLFIYIYISFGFYSSTIVQKNSNLEEDPCFLAPSLFTLTCWDNVIKMFLYWNTIEQYNVERVHPHIKISSSFSSCTQESALDLHHEHDIYMIHFLLLLWNCHSVLIISFCHQK